MPASHYNRYFGGGEGSAKKAKAAMKRKYGDDSAFYGYVENEKQGKPHKRPKRQYPEK